MTDDQLVLLFAFFDAQANGESTDSPGVAEVYIPRARRFVARHAAKLAAEKVATPDPIAADVATAAEGDPK